jgi:hypothetical protein
MTVLKLAPGGLAMVMLAVVMLALAGCDGRPSSEAALDSAIRSSGATKLQIARFAGTVTVDGQPLPSDNRRVLVIMLYDPKQPPDTRHPLLHTFCDETGHFEFGTYTHGDGVPVGSYVVLFALWKFREPGFSGPDGLKNLYNDPDKSEFKVDVTPAVKTDYEFNLKLEGRDGNLTPGPRAVTDIKNK